ncbi:hypothetical protein [Desulfosarcina cetonica]|uniref:hypothetical protein n=1 Tax=Desulfosarcina cetonica TaxID=90730 RepID=UPI0006D29BD2|nr:hypothetical protein [Desulfosarcina cetonica]
MLIPHEIAGQSDDCHACYSTANASHRRASERYLDLACRQFPVLGNAIRNHGNRSLCEYLDLIQPSDIRPLQPIEDLLAVAEDYARSLLGETIARRLATDLERSPMILTANHHGIAYFAQDFQGNLIFSLNRKGEGTDLRTVPVFACGTVPLDNLTYPLGMLCYQALETGLDSIPNKIPIFSNKMRRQMVSSAKPFKMDMIHRAKKRLRKMIRDRILPVSVEPSIIALLEKEYARSDVLDLPTYSQQSVVMNHALWNRIFKAPKRFPDLVVLELEKVAMALLEKDLRDHNSLAHCVMFDPELRRNVFTNLDGSRACWQTSALLRRLHADDTAGNWKDMPCSCGTMLFWGLDARGRRVPLYLETDSGNAALLRGIDDRGNVLEMPFSIDAILEALSSNTILPSVFTSLLVISLARGVTCVGGYFQCEYLPSMQAGLVKALNDTEGMMMPRGRCRWCRRRYIFQE